MQQNHLQKELVKKSIVILLLNTFDQIGFPHFYFYAIKMSNLDAFNAGVRNSGFELEKYGIVVEHGFGLPSDEIWLKMKKQYGLEKDKIAVINTKA